MAQLIKHWWDLLRGKKEESEVLEPISEESKLKRRIDDDELTCGKRMRLSDANGSMEKPIFRIEDKLTESRMAEWTTSSEQLHSWPGNHPPMESGEVVGNKENVLSLQSYREKHEKTSSSISKSEQSVLEDSDDDPAIIRVLPASSSTSRRTIGYSSLTTQGVRKKTTRQSLQNPSFPKHSAEMPTIELSDEDDVQLIENPSQGNGTNFSSCQHGAAIAYRTTPSLKPSHVLRRNKNKSMSRTRGLLFNNVKLGTTINTVNNYKEKKQFHELILQYTSRNNNHLPPPRTRYLDSPATLLKNHPVITIDQSGDDELQVVDVVQSRQKIPITSATMNGERSAKPKQAKHPIKAKILSGNMFSDMQFIKDTREKYELRNEETKRNIQQPKVIAEFLGAQNSRSTTACEESLLAHFKRMEIVLPDVIEVPALPELTDKMQAQISSAMRPNPRTELLVEAFSLRITRNDMYTLSGTNWLNDEVINYYMELLIERGKRKDFLNVYAFNTFFYPRLLSGGHASLKRWTRKIDIFAQEVIIIPVHLGVHWCLASIDFRDLTIRYYDSMGSSNNKCLVALLQYLKDESLDKKKCSYDTSKWKTLNLHEIPQQMNGSDCGMFACMFAEYICRNAPITFTQSDMPYFRRKMAYEILTKRLMDFSN